jgi:hypothetical protein
MCVCVCVCVCACSRGNQPRGTVDLSAGGHLAASQTNHHAGAAIIIDPQSPDAVSETAEQRRLSFQLLQSMILSLNCNSTNNHS